MVTTKQLSFAGGEVAPSLYARVDQVKHATGLRTCRNSIVQRHGGVANRAGTQFIVEVKDSTKKTEIRSFIFNVEQTYILEFGELYMRVIRDGVQIESSPGVAFELVTPYLEAELPELVLAQSADVITIVHPSHAPRELKRLADDNWTLTVITFAPDLAAPTGVVVAGTAGSETFTYHVTSISAATGEESLAAVETQGSLKDATLNQPHTITWTEEADASSYNIYKEVNGVPSFVGIAVGDTFVNDGIEPDPIDGPPQANNPFDGAGNFPSTVTYYQSRIIYANTNNKPESVFASRTGLFHNFTRSDPLQDDDAIEFTLAGRQVNEIKQMIELGTLVLFTTGGEWGVQGDVAGILKPVDVNPKQHSYHGSDILTPLIVGANALYVQARASIVRDLGFDFQVDGYRGNELSIFASHLFDEFTLVDWTFQQIPQSVVWVVRSDGVLLGLTYIREHQVWGWHRHDTDGLFENVAVVPEGNEDVLYAVVNRTIDGVTKRYIEKFVTRQVSPETIKSARFMDSTLSLDGTNLTATTMTLTGGPPWDSDEDLTLTASTPTFLAGDIGNEFHLTAADGDVIRCEITEFTSDTVVTVQPKRNVPVDLQGVATTNWAEAVDAISGLDHLEGKQVSVFGDAFVVASPNNEAYETITVTGGTIILPRPFVVIHVGLPYISDVETLDIDTDQGETLIDKNKLITNVHVFFEETRGVFAGGSPPSDDSVDPLEDLDEFKLRQDEDQDDPVDLITTSEEVNIKSRWNGNGRIFLRQVDPVPMTILAVAPAGLVPFRG